MGNISLLLAFSAGLLSFLSPCVIPLIPAYICYLTGTSLKELENRGTTPIVIYKSIGFIIGFSLIFIIMGASATSLGKAFISHRVLFRRLGGILIIIFGLHILGLFRVPLLYREKRLIQYDRVKGPFSSVLMGMAFAAGWTPCVGPILSVILVYAANEASTWKGVLLLCMYSLGLAIPFLLTAMAVRSFTKLFKKYSRYLSAISIISGVLMIIMGILIYENRIAALSQFTGFLNF